jgi:hypothetical protein
VTNVSSRLLSTKLSTIAKPSFPSLVPVSAIRFQALGGSVYSFHIVEANPLQYNRCSPHSSFLTLGKVSRCDLRLKVIVVHFLEKSFYDFGFINRFFDKHGLRGTCRKLIVFAIITNLQTCTKHSTHSSFEDVLFPR